MKQGDNTSQKGFEYCYLHQNWKRLNYDEMVAILVSSLGIIVFLRFRKLLTIMHGWN